MSGLAALIFDVDGTLADTERDGDRIAFNRAFAEAALDWHWSVELYGKLLAISGGKERIRRIRFYLQQFNPQPHPHLAFPGRGSSPGWGYENIARLRGLNPHPHPHLASPKAAPNKHAVARFLFILDLAGNFIEMVLGRVQVVILTLSTQDHS